MDDFNDRIMVSLTSLMVLAALYLQSNQAMPKTAYLKVSLLNYLLKYIKVDLRYNL